MPLFGENKFKTLKFQLRSPNMLKDVLKLPAFPNFSNTYIHIQIYIYTHTLDLVSTSIKFKGGRQDYLLMESILFTTQL